MSYGNRKRRRELGLLPEPQKCAARRTNGDPCNASPIKGGVVCRMHGGAAPQVRRKAAERIALLADDAVSFAGRVLHDEGADPALRMKAAQWIAGVNGLAPGQRVELVVGPTYSERVEELEAVIADDPQLQRVKERLSAEPVLRELSASPTPRALPAGDGEAEEVFPEYSDPRVIDADQVDDHYRYGPGTHPGPPSGPRARQARIQR